MFLGEDGRQLASQGDFASLSCKWDSRELTLRVFGLMTVDLTG